MQIPKETIILLENDSVCTKPRSIRTNNQSSDILGKALLAISSEVLPIPSHSKLEPGSRYKSLKQPEIKLSDISFEVMRRLLTGDAPVKILKTEITTRIRIFTYSGQELDRDLLLKSIEEQCMSSQSSSLDVNQWILETPTEDLKGSGFSDWKKELSFSFDGIDTALLEGVTNYKEIYTYFEMHVEENGVDPEIINQEFAVMTLAKRWWIELYESEKIDFKTMISVPGLPLHNRGKESLMNSSPNLSSAQKVDLLANSVGQRAGMLVKEYGCKMGSYNFLKKIALIPGQFPAFYLSYAIEADHITERQFRDIFNQTRSQFSDFELDMVLRYAENKNWINSVIGKKLREERNL